MSQPRQRVSCLLACNKLDLMDKRLGNDREPQLQHCLNPSNMLQPCSCVTFATAYMRCLETGE